MKILVLCEQYSSEGDVYRMAWAHTRNREYLKRGCTVDVLNFNAKSDYSYQGINVYTKSSAGYNLLQYDLVISHAPNIKNHYFYILKAKFKKIVFFFHGHEVLYTEKDYPKPYYYRSASWLRRLSKTIYDWTKIKLVKRLIHKVIGDKSHLIFVSEWMKDQYEKNIGVKLLPSKYNCIPNPVWHDFVDNRHRPPVFGNKIKVVTLRKLDESKYAVDLVVRIAEQNPNVEFHIFGKGQFFKHFDKPDNVIHTPQLVEQHKLADFFNNYHLALLPTRYDAQGVLACEAATYNMPLISSDISVVKEMLARFPHVYLMNNDRPEDINIKSIYDKLKNNVMSGFYFAPENTVSRELEVFERFTHE
ncbi:glycosyltransferase family 4 protein [Kangiella shandongensis]|uniref:glycosyltransferase family 4 protein n=1 Tax=Kangiella shandongensis TaxID=2763258 RepID=UPI001CBB24F3|nr:glycosyltransferase family 4 protein [Kangiella shandongensis]